MLKTSIMRKHIKTDWIEKNTKKNVTLLYANGSVEILVNRTGLNWNEMKDSILSYILAVKI